MRFVSSQDISTDRTNSIENMTWLDCNSQRNLNHKKTKIKNPLNEYNCMRNIWGFERIIRVYQKHFSSELC